MPSVDIKIVETPNPYEQGLAVKVRDTLLANNPSLWPSGGRTYAEFNNAASDLVQLDQSYAAGYGNYVYVDAKTGYTSSGAPQANEIPTTTFYFVQHKTDAQKSIPFRTTESFGNLRWPAVLKFVTPLRKPGFTRSTNGILRGKSAIILQPSYFLRYGMIPETNTGTRFLTEEYFADTPFSVGQPQTPVETIVEIDIPGLRQNFGPCLHKTIKIANTQTVIGAIVAGVQSSASESLEGQVFPRTNFTDWEVYIMSVHQEFQTGWYMRLIRAIPPEQPKIQIRDS